MLNPNSVTRFQQATYFAVLQPADSSFSDENRIASGLSLAWNSPNTTLEADITLWYNLPVSR